MATRTITVDDITGKETVAAMAATLRLTIPESPRTKTLKLNGEWEFTMDLAETTLTALHAFVAGDEHDARDLAAVWPARRRVTGSSTSGDNGDTEAIRAWAKEKGLTVAERGRISDEVREAFRKAHEPAEESRNNTGGAA